MKKSKSDILLKISELKGLTTYHYKVILQLLCLSELTQSQVAENLGVRKQNMNKIFKDLSSLDIIKINRTEGKNIFWSLNPNPRFEIKGQIKLDV